jgi:hypothetical protein
MIPLSPFHPLLQLNFHILPQSEAYRVSNFKTLYGLEGSGIERSEYITIAVPLHPVAVAKIILMVKTHDAEIYNRVLKVKVLS